MNCICGCKGRTLSPSIFQQIDVSRYKACPVRLERKKQEKSARKAAAKPVVLQPAKAAPSRKAVASDVAVAEPMDLSLFLRQNGLSAQDLYDAKGAPKSVYSAEMERLGLTLAYNVTPCAKAGHRLRNKYGKCVQCDTRQLGFNSRASQPGYVYAAHSRSSNLIKVGFAADVERRHGVLNSQQYAGANDWRLFLSEFGSTAGRREIAIHKALKKYAVSGIFYKWDGKLQEAREVYRCPLETVQRTFSQTK